MVLSACIGKFDCGTAEHSEADAPSSQSETPIRMQAEFDVERLLPRWNARSEELARLEAE
jgi:hypothetical protein